MTEGRPGVALTLRLTVVDALDVQAGEERGRRDLALRRLRHLLGHRGPRRTSASSAASSAPTPKGLAIFRTIYPGWYQGRTVHIHTMVHIGGNVVHTGQLYFSDVVTDAVYKRSPYNRRPNRNPRNSGDSIYRNGGEALDAEAREEGHVLHGLDHHGRATLVWPPRRASRSVYPNWSPACFRMNLLSREREGRRMTETDHVAADARVQAQEQLEQALFEIRRIIAGQDAMLERVLVCLLAQGTSSSRACPASRRP